MSPSDIKWLIENKITIPKAIGSDSIRVVESDDGVVSIEVGLPFERWKDLSYHDVMFDVFYGSGKTETEEQLTAAIGKMYAEMVNPAIPAGLCGVVYTQLSDVEEEINGLVTYDRQIEKADAAAMAALASEIYSCYQGEEGN